MANNAKNYDLLPPKKTDRTYLQRKLKDYTYNISKRTKKLVRKKSNRKMNKDMNEQFIELKNQKDQLIYQMMLSFTKLMKCRINHQKKLSTHLLTKTTTKNQQ